MVSIRWGGLAARAFHAVSTLRANQSSHALQSPYAADALQAAVVLQSWYDAPSGLWKSTGWWNGANCLTVLADWAIQAGPSIGGISVPGVISNTFASAQKVAVTAQKTLSASGLVSSFYTMQPTEKRGFSGFINDFYDDEGWWALALIRSYDLTRQKAYLDVAERIFRDMQGGADSTCGGGIWWSKERSYKNAIANELYLSVAASLANRLPASKQRYTQIAKSQWNWFRQSGMINSNNLINDGLKINADGSCVNNGMNTWSYNQGVILGGLVELAEATGDRSYLSAATAIATAAVGALSDGNGILHEIDKCEPNCGSDGGQFKGIFVRNLHYLQSVAPRQAFAAAIRRNADSIWANGRNAVGQLGVSWTGPADAGGGPTASTHCSAMDVLVAAMGVAS